MAVDIGVPNEIQLRGDHLALVQGVHQHDVVPKQLQAPVEVGLAEIVERLRPVAGHGLMVDGDEPVQGRWLFHHLIAYPLGLGPPDALAAGFAELRHEGVLVVPEVGGHRMPGIAHVVDPRKIQGVLHHGMKADELADDPILPTVGGEGGLEPFHQGFPVPRAGEDQGPAVAVGRDQIVPGLPVDRDVDGAPDELMGDPALLRSVLEGFGLARFNELACFSVPGIEIDVRNQILLHITRFSGPRPGSRPGTPRRSPRCWKPRPLSERPSTGSWPVSSDRPGR